MKIKILAKMDGEKLLRYAIEHSDEIIAMAAIGNIQAKRVLQSIDGLQKCKCARCMANMAEAVYYYRMGLLN